MPNPANLPPEIFAAVLDLALHDESGLQRLCGLSLLSRRWNAVLVGQIYSEWTYNGARQPFMVLWKFFRTVRTNPQLAALVQTLNIGNWGFYPDACLDGPSDQEGLQFPPDELELVRSAIHDAGIGHLEPSIVAWLPQRDRRPLMALLLTCLPNLSTVYAHVPRFDPVLGAVLEQAVRCPTPALRGLGELHLFQEISVIPDKEEKDSDVDSPDHEPVDRIDALRIDYLWPVFYLPGLRSLSLFEINTEEAANRLANGGGTISHLQNLYLLGDFRPTCTSADVRALILRPEALKSFSLYFQDNPFDLGDSIVPNTEIWDCLQKHHDDLESIDIYRKGFGGLHRDDCGHFGLLRAYASLKHVSLSAEMLVGGCCDSPQAPFRLKDTLPSTLQSLTLYGERGCRAAVTDLPVQLQEVLSGEFPSLKSIVLEELESIRDNSGNLRQPYQAVEHACKERRISFRVKKEDQLRMGGRHREMWMKTSYMRDDGYARSSTRISAPERFRDSRELLLRPADDVYEGEEDSDSDDGYGPYGGTGTTLSVHIVPFTDHTGNTPACMVFHNLETHPLPPLFSFSIYFTHPNASPEHTDIMTELQQQLSFQYENSDFDLRFDMYFLPGASHEECISHYQGEKAVRGSYKEQLKMFKSSRRDEVHPLPGSTGQQQLPGMVTEYPGMGYRGVLFVCPEQDWRMGERTLSYLKFDPSVSSDTPPRPPVDVMCLPINVDSPVYNLTGPEPVDGNMFDLAHWDREEYHEAWAKATSRGWTSW